MKNPNYSFAKTMQVATAIDNKPWLATVYFVEYKTKFYWLSEPNRRHSNELLQNPKCAIAIVIKEDMPVIGVQAEGQAKIVSDLKTIANIMPKYISKYGLGKEFISRAMEGINKHQLYEFTPNDIKIFNETED